jgi:hypothetical protein
MKYIKTLLRVTMVSEDTPGVNTVYSAVTGTTTGYAVAVRVYDVGLVTFTDYTDVPLLASQNRPLDLVHLQVAGYPADIVMYSPPVQLGQNYLYIATADLAASVNDGRVYVLAYVSDLTHLEPYTQVIALIPPTAPPAPPTGAQIDGDEVIYPYQFPT